jgi:hypothetical protein
MDDYHFSKFATITKNFLFNHIWENKKLTTFQKMDILYIMEINLLKI